MRGKLLTMLPVALALAGCQATGGSESKTALCSVLRPVTWSAKDTPETATQVRANNAVGKAVCGWKAGT